MHSSTIIWKNLRRRPARTLLTVAGIAVAVAAVVALVGVADGFYRSFLDLYTRRGCDLVVQHTGGMQRLSSGVDEKLGDRIRRLPGVRQVIGGLMDVVSFPESDLYAVIVNGWPPDCPVWNQQRVISGRRLHSGDRRRVMLGRVLAANLGKTSGDTVEIYAERFEVAGVFESVSVYENGAAFMLLHEMQRLVDRPGQVTGYVVLAERSDDRQAVAQLQRRIERLAPRLTVLPAAQFVGSISQIQLSRAVAWLTSAIAGVLGAIGMLNTMAMSVFERAREIGVLRAVGWRRSRIVRLLLGESVVIATVGAALGSLAAAALVQALGRFPATSGLIEGRIPPLVICQGFVLATVVGLAGAAWPALWAANLPPVAALRR